MPCPSADAGPENTAASPKTIVSAVTPSSAQAGAKALVIANTPAANASVFANRIVIGISRALGVPAPNIRPDRKENVHNEIPPERDPACSLAQRESSGRRQPLAR